jgi:predicted N-acyltransferase
MGDVEKIIARAAESMSSINAVQWDACANPGGDVPYNPFLSHAFLKALEESGSATAQTGWKPYHVLVEDGHGNIAGCAPAYLKGHSQGEFVFDYGWADAWERAGGQYYPKLQVSVPFTPATGRRLLARPGPDRQQTEDQIAAALVEITNQLGLSSCHMTFLPEDQWNHLGDIGFLQRTDQQFHWEDDGYGDFDGFLNALASRKRKNLKKERTRAIENDIEIEWVTGSDITEDHWDAFFTFYMDTGSRKWGSPYLTRTCFSMLGETVPDDLLLILAKRHGRYIAGALNMIGSETLFGRYWGCTEHHDFLHFEVCYYQAIDFALSRGLKRVEAGAQGSHKLARGYVPKLTYSAHYIPNPSFRDAVDNYLANERRHVAADADMLLDHAPFKKTKQNTPQD